MNQMSKQQRQHRIARLLERQPIASQTQLVEMLAADGVMLTQATVSRDLEDMGAVKIRVPGGMAVYAIPEQSKERVATDDHLRRVLREFVVGIIANASVVVVHTAIGSAHVVASAIDRHGIPGVIGTVAGDDTLLLVIADDHDASVIAGDLLSTAGLVGAAE